VPEDIVSDRGPQFTSGVWRAFMERLGVSISLTSGFHPESNGQVERVNQDVGRFLRSYCHSPVGRIRALGRVLRVTMPIVLTDRYYDVTMLMVLTDLYYDVTMPIVLTDRYYDVTMTIVLTDRYYDVTMPIVLTDRYYDVTMPIVLTDRYYDVTMPMVLTDRYYDVTMPIVLTNRYYDVTMPIVLTDRYYDVTMLMVLTNHVLSDVGHGVELLLTDLTAELLLSVTVNNLVVLMERPELLKGLATRYTLKHTLIELSG
jgi:hypothetical protein